MKKALALLAALSIVHYPLSILHAGTNAFVTVNTNTFQLSNLGFSTGGAGILWSNSATGAWGQIPTNSHIHLTDEHGSTYDFRTNGTLAISNLNGSYVTITNGNVTISGNFIGNGSMLTGVSGGGGSQTPWAQNINGDGYALSNAVLTNVTSSNSFAIIGGGNMATLTLTGSSEGGTSQTIQSSPGGLSVGDGLFQGNTFTIGNINADTGLKEQGNAVVTNNETGVTLGGNITASTATNADNFTGLLSGDVAGPQGATSVQTCQSNAILTNQFKYLFGFGDSYMAGDYAGIVTQTTTWYGQTPQTDYSQGYLFQAGSNCNLIISNWGFPGEPAPYIWAVDEEEEQLYPPPTNAEFVVNSGLNDWANNHTLQLTTYGGEMMTLMAWPEFGPEAKIFPTNNSGGGIVTSTNGYFIGSGWTETYWVANGSLNGGIYSTNKTNCIVVTNVFGSYFVVDVPAFGDGTGGTNVLYVDGISNCLISCNCYPDEYWSGQGIPYQMIGYVIGPLSYTNHSLIFSNATGCIVGYSGASLNVGLEWIGVVSQIVNPHPVYAMASAILNPALVPSFAIPESYNLAVQTNVSLLKAAGLPIDYVDPYGNTVLNPNNGNSAGSLHPNLAGHTAIANILSQHIKNNAAFDGLRTGTSATNNLPGLLPQLSIGNGAGMTTVSAVTGNFGSITTTGASTFDTGANVDGFGGSITVADNITSTAGNIQATIGNFTGNGSGLTALNAANLTGTLQYAQFSGMSGDASGTVLSNTGSGMAWAASPTGLTNINITNVTFSTPTPPTVVPCTSTAAYLNTATGVGIDILPNSSDDSTECIITNGSGGNSSSTVGTILVTNTFLHPKASTNYQVVFSLMQFNGLVTTYFTRTSPGNWYVTNITTTGFCVANLGGTAITANYVFELGWIVIGGQ